MSYQVLARKWRPRTFDEVAGQEHVLRALINALDNDRLHHAYLFTGTRGVGKTTLARILAKCLNCEQGVSSKACDQCSACTEINEGRFIDLIEVDAASRTKVEDTRELLDNVQYLPTRGRYKVYLIDEVHMLSSHSFNALLKTLEEPPPHVKFLLATTDPQKLPVTVLSRCLQFNLKNLSPERIVDYLKGILDKENVPFEEAALWALARAADGSMRDALSLTDQGIAHGDGKLTEAELSTMLGTIDRTAVLDICRKLAERDAPGVLALVETLAEHAPDYRGALAEILSIWHRVAVVQAVPGALDNSLGDQDVIRELAQQISREDVQLFYQICLLGRRDLPLAADPRSGLEMVLLRQLAFQPVLDEGLDPPPSSLTKPELIKSEPTESDPELSLEISSAHTQGDTEAVKKPEPGRSTVEAVPSGGSGQSGESAPPGEPTQPPEFADLGAGSSSNVDGISTASIVESEYAQLSDQDASHDGSDSVAPALPRAVSPVEDKTSVSKEPAIGQGGAVFTPEDWLETCYQLDISGRLLNIASNLELLQHSDDRFVFRLDQAQSALYNESHQQALAAALEAYFQLNHVGGVEEYSAGVISVVIEIAQVSAETPQIYRLRKQAERQAQAVQALHDDPLVKELEQRFGATLIEDSVIPLD